MNDNVNKMNEALAALCEKYSVAARGTISMDDKGNWKLACSGGKETFLLPWRTERKFVELKKFLDDKKGRDIKVLHVEDVTSIADYFVVCTATSNTHVKALSGEVEYQLEEAGIKADHIEGRATGWVLLEYKGVVVHIFLEDSRQYYNLERLWQDAKEVDISDVITED